MKLRTRCASLLDAAGSRLRQAMNRAASSALANIPDVLIVAGASSLSYGAWLIYPPCGFITAGALLLLAGILAARKD